MTSHLASTYLFNGQLSARVGPSIVPISPMHRKQQQQSRSSGVLTSQPLVHKPTDLVLKKMMGM
jgi:hypothetical protein